MSAHDLEEEVAAMRREIREQYTEKRAEGKNYLFDLFVLHGEPPIAIPSKFHCFLKYSWILY